MVIAKAWFLLRKYILTIPRFDLFLQGALLIVVFLESYTYLLLRRNDGTGYLRTINEDWVQLGVGGAEFLLGAVVAWWGRGVRHFALAGWLGVTAVSGLIVLAFPFAHSGAPSVELCGGEAISGDEVYDVQPAEDTLMVPRTVFLVLTAILCGLTKISVWAHGITYLDDHEPQSGPYFYGILISIRLSLGLSGQNWMRAVSVRDDWWEAQISLAMLTLMFCVLFTLFPRRMDGYKEFDETEYNCILKPIGRMLRNKAVLLQTVALSLLNTALFGYINYDNATIQAKFYVETLRQDPRTTRTIMDIFRSLVIIFFVSIFRMRFSIRRSDGVKANTASKVGGAVCMLVAVFFCVLAGLHCQTGRMDGFDDGLYQQPKCSAECGCGSENYGFSPVCILNTSTTYFSPCHAGCQQYEDLNGFLLFDECKCGPHRAVRGSCTLPECWLPYSIYLVFFTVVLAAAAASFLMQGMVILRAVQRRDKPIAVGVSFALMGLLSHVLGHFIYMIISYYTCAFEKDGICLLHNYSIWSVGAVSAGLSVLSGILSFVASRYPSAPELLSVSDVYVNGR